MAQVPRHVEATPLGSPCRLRVQQEPWMLPAQCVGEARGFGALCESRLFQAVEVNDVVDADVALPDRIDLACSQAELQQCLDLCRRFWLHGVDRRDLVALIRKQATLQTLSTDERLRYKHMRARYKHLRSAQRLYRTVHKTTLLFLLVTGIMGDLQDALRNKQRRKAGSCALALCVLLTPPCWWLTRWQVRHTRIDSVKGFLEFCQRDIGRLPELLRNKTFTGQEFHSVRRIIGRLVSFYDTQRSLLPREHPYRMSRFLAAINGLMGAAHDDMVAQAASGQRRYHARLPLDPDIRTRLEQLVNRFPHWPPPVGADSP